MTRRTTPPQTPSMSAHNVYYVKLYRGRTNWDMNDVIPGFSILKEQSNMFLASRYNLSNIVSNLS